MVVNLSGVIRRILENHLVGNVLSALFVLVFGFILLNLAFILDYAFQSLIDLIVKQFVSSSININIAWQGYMALKHGLFVVLILIISYFVFKSKLHVLFKVTYLLIPITTMIATVWMFLYPWPIIAFVLEAILILDILYYLYLTKRHWLYYYAVVLISLVLLLVGIFGVEI